MSDLTRYQLSRAAATLGWKATDSLSSAFAIRQVVSAGKTDNAYLYFGYDGQRIRLTAQYDSQGHNILSTITGYIPKNATDSDLNLGVAGFIAAVDDTINNAKMVRLHREQPRQSA